jgi:DNA polymerase bacteriophage-type
MRVPVYDILNCGPRNRFVANGKLVHNSDSINMQNLPSRGPHAKKLKKCILAPEGYVLIDCDSSQIEARVVAWLAEQDDVVQAFRDRKDVYNKMASAIYAVAEEDVTPAQRFIGKTVVLGCGYGLGAAKLRASLGTSGVEISEDEARHIINVYRDTNWKIAALWKAAGYSIQYLARGDRMPFGKEGVLNILPEKSAIVLPSGLNLYYDGLRTVASENGTEYAYDTRNGMTRIYGGKCVENVCQAIARCVIGEQMLRIAKRYRIVMTVHDSVVACVPEQEAEKAQRYIEQCMRWVPSWAEGLPVNCKSEVHRSYGG